MRRKHASREGNPTSYFIRYFIHLFQELLVFCSALVENGFVIAMNKMLIVFF